MNRPFSTVIWLACATAILAGAAPLLTYAAEPEITARVNLDSLPNSPNKDYSARMILGGKRAHIQMRVHFVEYQSALHDRGFKLTEARSVAIESPALPAGCAHRSTFGFLNGFEGAGGNLISLVLDGQSCSHLIEELQRQPLSLVLHDVPTLQSGAPNTVSLRIQILDLP